MWSDIPYDLLAHIFSLLSPDSLARAISTCTHWHTCAKTCSYFSHGSSSADQPPWFLAIHSRSRTCSCYAHNPTSSHWYLLPLHFLPDPVRPLATIGPLLLCRSSVSPSLHLLLCNPFTRQHRLLPPLNVARAHPAVGVVQVGPSSFQVYAAGGMSAGGTYEPTLETYDSRCDAWHDWGPMPVELAVRLTVWTSGESVWSGDALYWVTCARAYSVMGFEPGARSWREVRAPMADRLECAALVSRLGRLALFGGTCGGEAYVWELGVGDMWALVERVPPEMGRRFLGARMQWASTRCVGSGGALYLYRELGCGMLVWKEFSAGGKWEWCWVEGCSEMPRVPIKGVLLHPTLDPTPLAGFFTNDSCRLLHQ